MRTSAALAAALAILSVSCSRIGSGSASGPPPPPPSEPPPASLGMGPFQAVTGTSGMYAEITESHPGRGMKSEKYGGDGGSRNVVFLDGVTLQSHQLFETNGQLVSQISQVGAAAKPQSPTAADATKPVRWLMYRVVREDTDKDGHLDDGDRFSVGFSDAAGNGYVDVLQRVESILGVSVVTDDQLTLAYVVDGRGLASRVDIPTRAVLETREIVGFPAPPPPN